LLIILLVREDKDHPDSEARLYARTRSAIETFCCEDSSTDAVFSGGGGQS
jgi:hypothetical protein